MPVLPSSLLEPRWDQFSALLPEHPAVAPSHPLGCHRRRIANRVVFEHVIAALVHGSGYERIASPGGSDRTIRRRGQAWAAAGLMEQVHTLALTAYERRLGLDLAELAVDGGITRAPSGGDVAGRCPVERGQPGLKRSVVTEGRGRPVQVVSVGATRHDSPRLAPTLAGLEKVAPFTAAEPGTAQVDRGDDNGPSRARLADLGLDGMIARQGVPAPIQAGSRWKVERTHAWMTGDGKLRRCTDKRQAVVDCYLFLAAALVVTRRLIKEVRTRYRWPGRPTTRRLK